MSVKLEPTMQCRTCLTTLTTNDQPTNLFENGNYICEMLMELAPVKITVNDEYPSKICQICLHKLNTSYSFRQQCIDSDRLLRSNKLTKRLVKREDDDMIVKVESDTINDKDALTNETDERPCKDETKRWKKPLREFICSCGRRFPNKLCLKSHELVHKEPSLPCDQCGKKFRRKVLLEIHLRRHTGEHVATCQFCGKQFAAKKFLAGHLRTHMPKQFKCDTCARAFAERQSLKRHILCHTGERPFKCDACGKTFNRLTILKTHMLVHTDARPFKCETCAQAFKTSKALRKHSAKHR